MSMRGGGWKGDGWEMEGGGRMGGEVSERVEVVDGCEGNQASLRFRLRTVGCDNETSADLA
jgi:hypothetical protein